jgi:hypothetical protein
MIFVRQETVTKGHDAAGPAVMLQKIERDCRSMIQVLAAPQAHDLVAFLSCDF